MSVNQTDNPNPFKSLLPQPPAREWRPTKSQWIGMIALGTIAVLANFFSDLEAVKLLAYGCQKETKTITISLTSASAILNGIQTLIALHVGIRALCKGNTSFNFHAPTTALFIFCFAMSTVATVGLSIHGSNCH